MQIRLNERKSSDRRRSVSLLTTRLHRFSVAEPGAGVLRTSCVSYGYSFQIGRRSAFAARQGTLTAVRASFSLFSGFEDLLDHFFHPNGAIPIVAHARKQEL